MYLPNILISFSFSLRLYFTPIYYYFNIGYPTQRLKYKTPFSILHIFELIWYQKSYNLSRDVTINPFVFTHVYTPKPVSVWRNPFIIVPFRINKLRSVHFRHWMSSVSYKSLTSRLDVYDFTEPLSFVVRVGFITFRIPDRWKSGFMLQNSLDQCL